MSQSMKGLKRTHYCTDLSEKDLDKEITVMGWVQTRRNLGKLIFIDLRDRTGLLQIVFDENITNDKDFKEAQKLRSEFVIAVKGKVYSRGETGINPDMKTGAIEIYATELRILSESETPPVEIVENTDVRDELRLKYRYLDLRRPDMQRNMILRSKVSHSVREFFNTEGFLEIETPMLTKSTPEGARDYLVPSRLNPGEFYALPQSPQLFKQLLMVSGYDRYYQIVKCFRDEDLRSDRQPEFTQIDMELTFVDEDDVMDINEKMLKKVFKETIDVDVELPIDRITYKDAMERYGSDKPDVRFGLELVDISEEVKDSGFRIFDGAIADGGSVRAINASGLGEIGRRGIDDLVKHGQDYGAKGVAWIQIQPDGNERSSFAKFISEEVMEDIKAKVEAKENDLILVVADQDKAVFAALGALRLEVARQLELTSKDDYKFVWVTDFPLFEYDEEAGRHVAVHHPFTMPKEEDLDLLDTDPGSVRAKAYDICLNGVELGGGSIRIHQREIQEKMFEILGFSEEEAYERFGFLLNAFKYGTPPHGGLAYGLDRMVMLMCQASSIRDVIAFPKVKDASCLLTNAPSPVDDKQLEELSLKFAPRKK